MSDALVPATLATRWLGRRVDAHEVVSSTNDRAWELDSDGAAHGTVVVAGAQRAGRGRQGRRWNSHDGGLFVSVLLRLSRAREDAGALSLIAGLELARTLRDGLGLPGVGLKWPNDVWIDGRKAAGLLLESRVDRDLRVVVGLGMNLRRPPDGWGELEGRATALDEHGLDLRPADVLAHFLPRLESGVDAFERAGFDARLPEWADFDVLDGRSVDYRSGERTRRGRVDGITADGALRVTHGDGSIARLVGGEVHLVGVDP